MMNPETREKANVIESTAQAIRPHLHGNPPEVISVILSDLIATFIAGFPAGSRDDMLNALVDSARGLVHINELLMFGPGGHPTDRGRTRQ
jgi:hypothetical protein